MNKNVSMMLALSVALLPVTVCATPASAAVKPAKYGNCQKLNKYYPHGVAVRKGVRDKVRGTTRPVTTFTVNAKVYQLNKGLDRDRDGIACEKR